MEVLPIPLQRYLHSNRPHLKASQLETCCMPAYRLSYVRAPDYSGEAARQASNGSFDFSVPTLQSLPPPTGRGRLKEAQKKGLEWWNGCRRKRRERCVKRKGTLRGGDRSDGTLGNGREETERRRKHERAGESRGRLKTRRARTAPRRGNDKLHILSPHKPLYLLYFILPAKCWHTPALSSRKPRAVLPVFDKGDHGGWSSVDPRRESGFDGGMLLFAAVFFQPVGNASLGFPQLTSC